MDDKRYYTALILFTTFPKGVTAIDIVKVSDFINRGGPSADELYEGLNFLYTNGLVARKRNRFIRTVTGDQLVTEEGCRAPYDTCVAIARKLAALPPIEPSTEIISMKEAEIAVNRYGRFGCLFILWPF